jgi:hypothetical protein
MILEMNSLWIPISSAQQIAVDVQVLAIMRIQGYDKLVFSWKWVAWSIAALMVSIVCWSVVVRIIRWWRQPSKSPVRLMRRLMQVHRLQSSERMLIRQLVKNLPHNLQPIIFVDPTLWTRTATESDAQRIEKEGLYQKIFGFPPDSPATS